MNDLLDPVRSGAHAPAEISDGVIGADRARVANTLHSIASNGTNGGCSVAQAHIHRICGMSKVVNAGTCSVLMPAKVVVWRGRKSEPRCCHSLAWRLVGNDGEAVR